MKVIFLKDVAGAGRRDEIKDISDGYALNFLIPKGLAAQATKDKVAATEKRRAQDTERSLAEAQMLRDALTKLNGKTLEMEARANPQGHLFKGIGTKDIIAALGASLGHSLDESALIDSDFPIKEIGKRVVQIHAAGVHARVTIEVRKLG